MHKDAKNMDYVSIDTEREKRVGRPSRSDADRMKTIAWYHALANGRKPVDMINWLPFSDIDPRTIYRYRKGEIPPRRDFLNSRSEEFIYAKSVYEVGPLQIPLWDALWGAISSEDISLANQLMPGAQWPPDMLSELFFDDGDLARISDFREMYLFGKESSSASDFECFVGAIRVTRAWGNAGHKDPLIFRRLLAGTMAFPGAIGVLGRFGLVEAVQNWIDGYFHGRHDRDVQANPSATWYSDVEELSRRLQIADRNREKLAYGVCRVFSG